MSWSNIGCCPAVCSCCRNLGIPWMLKVTIPNVLENYFAPFGDPPPTQCCNSCDIYAGDWYPTLTNYPGSEYWSGLGDRYVQICWYHLSMGIDPDCNACYDDAMNPWLPECGGTAEGQEEIESVDLWIGLSCPIGEDTIQVIAGVFQNGDWPPPSWSPDDPVPAGYGPIRRGTARCAGLRCLYYDESLAAGLVPCDDNTYVFCEDFVNGITCAAAGPTLPTPGYPAETYGQGACHDNTSALYYAVKVHQWYQDYLINGPKPPDPV